ncbi:MAG: 3,4-dihydroxy-2-butanone-4-phosphate synthase [Candidatus ainarchaeum sp.]|nr:3,4-dihydroxy-2-butanone-4-phosphate synthase [Candidatus ainarchaeum sp.]
MDVDGAAAQLKKGGMAVLYDGEGREGEADLVFSARFATPEKVETLRRDAGGLICAAVTKADADSIGLPFYTELLEKCGMKGVSCRKTAYGDRPAFSISINHRNVYTGITDDDRALTLKKLDEVLRDRKWEFAKEFYSPGHVFLLIGSGLENRRGHTELSLELARRARLGGAMVLCEMLGKGKALPKEQAMAYAQLNGLPFIEGKELV